jgi:hypothetical protein
VRFNEAYLGWRGSIAMKRMKGEKYQVPGACPRGEAKPVVTPQATAAADAEE